MIRKAKPQDIPSIVDIAVESVSQNPIPVRIDREAMADEARIALNPAHFLWVSEIDGKIVAAFCAMVSHSFWFRGKTASVLLYYTRVPGEGIKLIREFSRWVKSRSGIKVVAWEFEPETDPRLIKFVKRLGFNREFVGLSYVRKANVESS